MEPERLEQFMDFLDRLEKQSRDFPRSDEVMEALKSVFDLMAEMRERHHEELKLLGDGLRKKIGDELSQTVSRLEEAFTTLAQELESGLGQMGESHSRQILEETRKAKDSISELLKPLDKRLLNVEGRKMPEIPKNLVDESRLLGEIKSLRDELKKEIDESKKQSASGSPRRIFRPYVDDFSGQTNGSKKIFYLSREPLKTDTILVWGTDFPVILRPTTDFTVSGKTLTLTSAVPAPSSGATLLVMYHS